MRFASLSAVLLVLCAAATGSPLRVPDHSYISFETGILDSLAELPEFPFDSVESPEPSPSFEVTSDLPAPIAALLTIRQDTASQSAGFGEPTRAASIVQVEVESAAVSQPAAIRALGTVSEKLGAADPPDIFMLMAGLLGAGMLLFRRVPAFIERKLDQIAAKQTRRLRRAAPRYAGPAQRKLAA